jgi:hypothetical protein
LNSSAARRRTRQHPTVTRRPRGWARVGRQSRAAGRRCSRTEEACVTRANSSAEPAAARAMICRRVCFLCRSGLCGERLTDGLGEREDPRQVRAVGLLFRGHRSHPENRSRSVERPDLPVAAEICCVRRDGDVCSPDTGRSACAGQGPTRKRWGLS